MTQNDENHVKIIGLTGRSGSGKTAAADFLEELGAFVIDCDRIVHDLLNFNKNAINEICEVFGKEILCANGAVNRQKLSSVVFDNKDLLKILTEITHRYVIEEVLNRIKHIKSAEYAYKYIVIDAPLLIEANLHVICHSVWVLYTEEHTAVERITKRDNISKAAALKRLKNQMPFEKLKQYADVLIKNKGNMDELRAEVEKYLKFV